MMSLKMTSRKLRGLKKRKRQNRHIMLNTISALTSELGLRILKLLLGVKTAMTNITKTSANVILLLHVLLLSDIVLTTPLFAALKLAGRKAGDGTLNFIPFVSNGILTIPAKIVDEFGLSLLKPVLERNAVRMASYGMMPHVN